MIRHSARQTFHLLVMSGILLTGFVPDFRESQAATPVRNIPVTLGDYRFIPDSIKVGSGETVQLELTNIDSLTPHNFTLRDETAGLDLDIDVSAGKTEIVEITPLPPGTYKYYCNKNLPFVKSHRDRGMEGTLVVAPTAPE